MMISPLAGGQAGAASAVAAAVFAGVAGFLLPRAGSPAARRLRTLLPDDMPASDGRPTGPAPHRDDTRYITADEGRRTRVTRLGVTALAGVASAVLVGGAAGLLAGAGVAVACARLLARMEPREARERRARLVADLPVAVDLLAACLRGGSSWGESVEAVATAVGGPLGARLHWVAAQVRLGADPVATWLALADEPALAGLARAAARAADSGSALAPTLARLAQDQRRAARAEGFARARAAGVRAVAPLGLCFLPSFVLIGIVPAVVGIATDFLLPR